MKIRALFRYSLVLPVILLSAVDFHTSLAVAQSVGTFALTGAMTTPRWGHTATLLPNGKVLVAGGIAGGDPVDGTTVLLASAELYDPSTGAFTPTGSMLTARWQATATLLADGRVLIAGGSPSLSGGAEIYDPSTGAFPAAGDMVANTYSWVKDAPLLPDGRVFVAGYPTAEIYDPTTGAFTATAPYLTGAPSILEAATLLADGRVLLTGAINICYQPQCAVPGTGWAEIYDPVADAFSTATGLSGWNGIDTASLLASGKVLIAGTDIYSGAPPYAEIFDPSDGTFTPTASPSAVHEYGATALLPDGEVLFASAAPELYMPGSETFSAAGNLISLAAWDKAILLPDGTVLIGGGLLAGTVTSSAELYRPTVLTSSPELFAIWDATTGLVHSAAMPAVAGEILSMYTWGLTEGSVIPPQVSLGGSLAQILYFGDAPGYPGFFQVNFRVPNGIAPGSAVPVRLTYLGRSSNEVTIAIE
jgi:hypothetical protein